MPIILGGEISHWNSTYNNFDWLNGNNGFYLQYKDCFQHNEVPSMYVAKVNDFNGDGYGDFAYANCLILGGSHISINKLETVNNGTFRGVEFTGLGESRVRSGDVNGDGLSDLVLSPIQRYNNQLSVVYGRKDLTKTQFDLNLLDSKNGFYLLGAQDIDIQYFGLQFSLTDVNGDGIDDIITTGSYNYNPRAYIIYGKKSSFENYVYAHTYIDGKNGVIIEDIGRSSGIYFSIGDFNGD